VYRLSKLFKDERERQGFTKADLARRFGYKNISKGASRIANFERCGSIHWELLAKLADILGISHATIKELADLDRADYVAAWNAWADEPIEMRIVMRIMAAMYVPRKVPPGFTQQQAEDFTASMAREAKKRCCLVVSRRLTVWFDENGQVENRTVAEPDSGPNWPIWGVP